ncbi:hypothetical protein JXO52_05860 [bacterium]|nr:hypothetical protein [bacterium]
MIIALAATVLLFGFLMAVLQAARYKKRGSACCSAPRPGSPQHHPCGDRCSCR